MKFRFYLHNVAHHLSNLNNVRNTHHLLRVLRLKRGGTLLIFNGNEVGEYQAKFTGTQTGLAQVTIQQFIARNVESPLTIDLGQVISRGEKMDYTIQKTTELGVSSITPLFSERCNVNLDATRLSKKLEHWRKIAIAASEQSGRIKIPVIKPPENLVNWLNKPTAELKLILSPINASTASTLPTSCHNLALLAGPEGGLSMAEEELASRSQFQSLHLGPRILRTETAALTAISILQARYGDLKTIKN